MAIIREFFFSASLVKSTDSTPSKKKKKKGKRVQVLKCTSVKSKNVFLAFMKQ